MAKELSTFAPVKQTPKTLLLLYVLLGYVTLQFVWWAYLIYDLNIDVLNLQAQLVGEEPTDEDLDGKLWMIIGEGSVFFSLLMVGGFYIRKFILREQRLARQERNFLLATTHEFNSPIAAVKLNLQTLQRTGLSEDQRSKITSNALSANARLQNLVSNLLTASRIDSGRFDIHREKVHVHDLLNRISANMRSLAADSGNTLEVNCEVTDELNLDSTAVELVLNNLISNAFKYAPGTNITISASNKNNTLRLSVTDEGPGIAEGELKNIFRKFYRVGNEETRSKKGTGLGLYLVKEIVQLQGGEISVQKGPKGKGIRFEISLKHV